MITVFATEITARVQYIFELYFEELLKVNLNLVTDKAAFVNAEGVKLNYSHHVFECGQLDLRPHELLFQTGLNYQDLSIVPCNEMLCFFSSSDDSFLTFDLFAAGFFLVTRYEEYLERQFGKHRRYPSQHSVLYRNHVLGRPVVNEWAQLLAGKIKKLFPHFKYQLPVFDFLTTIDVDNAWAYKNKSWFRIGGAGIKTFLRGDSKTNRERFNVLAGKEEDPYDTYGYIRKSYSGMNQHLHFFFLLGKPGKYDRNVSPKNENLRQLIRDLSKDYMVGIHPSYRSNKIRKELKREKKILEKITKMPVETSRQHFLKLELPKTYRRLIRVGIKTDFTMGYSESLGFRAGIASPFWFYDLKNEQKTSLRVMPFQTMDITMKDYLKLSPEQAFAEIKKIMLEVKKSGGTFISLWHNESLNDRAPWEGWRWVFEQMTELAIKLKDGKA